MTKNHLKARSAPRTWNIARKEKTFTTRPNPGSQKMDYTLPLALVMRAAKMGETKKELNHIMRSTPVTVNGKRRYDLRFGVGFMDVIAVPEHKQYFVLTMDDHGRLLTQSINENVSNAKVAQVRSKSVSKGNKLHLHLTDGENALIDAKEASKYPAGASVTIDVASKKIVSVHPLGQGANVILTSGKHRGKRGVIQAIEGDFVSVETTSGAISTKKSYAFVLNEKAAGGAQ